MAIAEVDPSESVYEKLQEILKAATRSAEVTRQLLSFARKQIVLPEVFDINSAVDGMFNMLRNLIGDQSSLVWLPHANRMPVRMDPSQFDQIVVNLCINARDAIGGSGKIIIKTATATFDETYCKAHKGFVPGEFVLLSIRDNGSGIEEDILDNIFEPFFTTKDKISGTGLGLASVYGTVKQNNGFIDVRSQPGLGTTFNIYLPLHTGQMPEQKEQDSTTFHRGKGETVLIVEDEEAILELVKNILGSLNYNVLGANNSVKAMELALHCDEEINLLLTDVIMPEMNGRDLANRLRSNQPNMRCLYMSGYTADEIANKIALEQNFNFIQKPFNINHLAQKVRETLDSD